MNTLGDVGPHDDESYDVVSDSSVSLDYFRKKYGEFQLAMNALDKAYEAAKTAYFQTDPPDEELYNYLMEYESRAGEIKTTAEALNLGANAANALGIRMPVLSVPQSLGALQFLALPAVTLAALAAIATILTFAAGYIAGVEMAIERVIQSVPDDKKPELVEALNKATQSKRDLMSNPLAYLGTGIGNTLSSAIKLAGIGLIGYLIYKSWSER